MVDLAPTDKVTTFVSTHFMNEAARCDLISLMNAGKVLVTGTLIPAIQFAGMLNPVSSLEGAGAFIARICPASHFLTISPGVLNKALGFSTLQTSFWPLLLAVPVILGLSIVLLKKQES